MVTVYASACIYFRASSVRCRASGVITRCRQRRAALLHRSHPGGAVGTYHMMIDCALFWQESASFLIAPAGE